MVAPASWVAGKAAAAGLGPVQEVFGPSVSAPRLLSLFNTHTGESQTVPYCADGQYLPDGLRQLQALLRDHRSGESHPFDPRLFDVLHRLAELAGTDPQFEVISGYRSPASNAQLAANSSGVASKSLHMQGKAIDVRLRNVPLPKLRDLALELKQGGVGYYAKSGFVHLDTGRIRAWTG